MKRGAPGRRVLTNEDPSVRVLSDQAPELHEALERAAEDEMPHLILDGTVIAAGRLSETKIYL